MLHQEATRASELIRLHRYDRHTQFLAGQVRARHVEALGFIGIDARRPPYVTERIEFLYAVVKPSRGAAGCVIVDGLAHVSVAFPLVRPVSRPIGHRRGRVAPTSER